MVYGWKTAAIAVALCAYLSFWWPAGGWMTPWRPSGPTFLTLHHPKSPPTAPRAAVPPIVIPGPGPKENATFVTLCRNFEIYEILESIQGVEDRFNGRYHYDWVFLNDVEFTPEFRSAVSSVVSGKAYFGQVPHHHWSYPPWINETLAAEARERMAEGDVIYGGSESYRHMCRFESGFFFHHPIVQRYRYYWRVEPGIKLYCDLKYDVFAMMRTNGKAYGFAISLLEYANTVTLLWATTVGFIKENRELINTGPDSMNEFVVDHGYDHEASIGAPPEEGKYNLCHFWTNFEIADMDFFRSEAYTRFFNYLDRSGGFFYERWGDAPVHSLAVGLFLNKSQVHWFGDVGYSHLPYMQCPLPFDIRMEGKCSCDPRGDFSFETYSCTGHFLDITGKPRPELVV